MKNTIILKIEFNSMSKVSNPLEYENLLNSKNFLVAVEENNQTSYYKNFEKSEHLDRLSKLKIQIISTSKVFNQVESDNSARLKNFRLLR